jgi:hypothetical protein
MQVEFHKTAERRYAILIRREGLPDLKMDPAPGFDPLMPHDLLHFLVEQELGLRRGIFGQLAHGATAGTFRLAPSDASNNRAASRLRRKSQRDEKQHGRILAVRTRDLFLSLRLVRSFNGRILTRPRI